MANIIIENQSVFRDIARKRKIFIRVADGGGMLVEVSRRAAIELFKLADATGHYTIVYEKRPNRRLILSLKRVE